MPKQSVFGGSQAIAHTHETEQVAPCSFQQKTIFDSELSDDNNVWSPHIFYHFVEFDAAACIWESKF